MNVFQILTGKTSATFVRQDDLLAHLEKLLGTGEAVTVSVPKLAVDVIRGVMRILEQNRVKPILMVDSDPEAIDYISQSLLGGSLGSVGGAVGGVWTLSVLSRYGYVIPGVGWVLTAATLLGFMAGTLTGFAVTRMGLRVRFVEAETFQIELVPLTIAQRS